MDGAHDTEPCEATIDELMDAATSIAVAAATAFDETASADRRRAARTDVRVHIGRLLGLLHDHQHPTGPSTHIPRLGAPPAEFAWAEAVTQTRYKCTG